jgi:hypothetical protein
MVTALPSTPISGSFRIIDFDARWQVASYLDHPDLMRFFCTCKGVLALKEKNNQQLERMIFSRVEIFGRTQWEEYWNAQITGQFDPNKIDILVLRKFLKTYYGSNPIGPGLVKDHCLIPTVVPQTLTVNGEEYDYGLKLLGELAEKPAKGHAAKIGFAAEALRQHGTDKPEAAHLVLLLKGVVARNKPWSTESQKTEERGLFHYLRSLILLVKRVFARLALLLPGFSTRDKPSSNESQSEEECGQVQYLEKLKAQTGYECETQPDATQITVVLAHHAVTGECPFGNEKGMEKRWTYGRMRELVKIGSNEYHMIVGGFSAGGLDPLGGSAPAVLAVLYSSYFVYENYGVGVLRKF